MAYDKYSVEYHLTPRGWIAGTTAYFGTKYKIVNPPLDRVETWLKDAEKSSGCSQEDTSWTRTWYDTSKGESELKTLRDSFEPPVGFPTHAD